MRQNRQKKGIHLAIASSKPKEFVEKVLRHFEIRRYFEVVVGSEKDGRKVEKIDVMREALSRMFSVPEEHIQSLSSAEIGKNDLSSAEIGKDSSPSETLQEQIPWGDILMVGDRKFDVLGAKAFSIRCAAVVPIFSTLCLNYIRQRHLQRQQCCNAEETRNWY